MPAGDHHRCRFTSNRSIGPQGGAFGMLRSPTLLTVVRQSPEVPRFPRARHGAGRSDLPLASRCTEECACAATTPTPGCCAQSPGEVLGIGTQGTPSSNAVSIIAHTHACYCRGSFRSRHVPSLRERAANMPRPAAVTVLYITGYRRRPHWTSRYTPTTTNGYGIRWQRSHDSWWNGGRCG